MKLFFKKPKEELLAESYVDKFYDLINSAHVIDNSSFDHAKEKEIVDYYRDDTFHLKAKINDSNDFTVQASNVVIPDNDTVIGHSLNYILSNNNLYVHDFTIQNGKMSENNIYEINFLTKEIKSASIFPGEKLDPYNGFNWQELLSRNSCFPKKVIKNKIGKELEEQLKEITKEEIIAKNESIKELKKQLKGYKKVIKALKKAGCLDDKDLKDIKDIQKSANELAKNNAHKANLDDKPVVSFRFLKKLFRRDDPMGGFIHSVGSFILSTGILALFVPHVASAMASILGVGTMMFGMEIICASTFHGRKEGLGLLLASPLAPAAGIAAGILYAKRGIKNKITKNRAYKESFYQNHTENLQRWLKKKELNTRL